MENSHIQWTTHTFNPWIGCMKVSPGCQHCYAETWAHRYQYNVWGPAKTTPRRRTSIAKWKEPRKWEREAVRDGRRIRVFCASLADVFEDHPMVTPWRAELWPIIEQTPHLDWQLLTKRPENVLTFVPPHWVTNWPPHVWIGTSVEDQQRVDERIPILLTIPAAVRFLSCEPLLGPLDLRPWLAGIQWVIVGGESEAGARPMCPDWARSLRDQCRAAGVPFFMKQMGGVRDKGGSFDVIPTDLHVREMPQ